MRLMQNPCRPHSLQRTGSNHNNGGTLLKGLRTWPCCDTCQTIWDAVYLNQRRLVSSSPVLYGACRTLNHADGLRLILV
jgi:hypothetical protein